jgi:hypothetical protein
MKIKDLTEKQKERIIEEYYDAQFLKAKGRKIINNILQNYNLNYSQLWSIAVRKNRPHLMRRHNVPN